MIFARTKAEYHKLMDALEASSGPIAFDTETVAFDDPEDVRPWTLPIIGAGFWSAGARGYARGEFLDERFQKLIDSRPIVMHNAQFDMSVIEGIGFDVSKMHCDDTLIMSALVNENRQTHGLKALAKSVLGIKEVTTFKEVGEEPPKGTILWAEWERRLGEYCVRDVQYTFELYHDFKPRLEKDGLWRLYDELERPLIDILRRMTRRGIRIDVPYLTEMRGRLSAEIKTTKKAAVTLWRDEKNDQSLEPNIGSNPQLQEYFFRFKGYVVPDDFTTDKGDPSTDKEALKYLIEEFDDKMAALVLRHRELTKLLSTYVEGILKRLDEDAVVHPSFRQLGAKTGRLSCVPLGTEILTRTGWKKHDEIAKGDSVMGYDIQKGSYCWTELLDVHYGKGQVGIIKNNFGHERKKGIWCTEGHRWIAEGDKVTGFAVADGFPRKFSLMLQPRALMPAPVDSALTPTEAALYGWYLTDGFTTGKVHYGLGVNLAKARSRRILEELLASVPHTLHKYKLQNDGSHYIHAYHVSSSIFDGIYRKAKSVDPSVFILSLSLEARKAMFAAMLEADGSMRRGAKRYDRFGVAEDHHKSTKEYFELLSLSLGQPFTYRVAPARTDLKHNRRAFVHYFLLKDRALYADKNSNWKPVKEEEVWCPETACGTWVMRQGRDIAVTGNSANPNAQNIGRRADEFDIRHAFIPREGHVFVDGDFSQIEPRLTAFISGDEQMLKVYADGGDIHQTVADAIGCDRQTGKTMGLAILYGMSSYSLARKLKIEKPAAQRLIDDYFQKFPSIQAFIARANEEMRTTYAVRSLLGRKRRFPDYAAAVHAGDEKAMSRISRQTVNAVVQGTAADIMKLALRNLAPVLKPYGAQMLLNVHDEVIVEVASEHAEAVKQVVKDTMENCIDLGTIRMKVDPKIMPKCWGKG